MAGIFEVMKDFQAEIHQMDLAQLTHPFLEAEGLAVAFVSESCQGRRDPLMQTFAPEAEVVHWWYQKQAPWTAGFVAGLSYLEVSIREAKRPAKAQRWELAAAGSSTLPPQTRLC